jgi:hypothetical protein
LQHYEFEDYIDALERITSTDRKVSQKGNHIDWLREALDYNTCMEGFAGRLQTQDSLVETAHAQIHQHLGFLTLFILHERHAIMWRVVA